MVALVYVVGAGVHRRSGREPVTIPIATDSPREDQSQQTRSVADWLIPALDKYDSGTIVFDSEEEKREHRAALIAANLPLIEAEIPMLNTSTRQFEERKRLNGTKRK